MKEVSATAKVEEIGNLLPKTDATLFFYNRCASVDDQDLIGEAFDSGDAVTVWVGAPPTTEEKERGSLQKNIKNNSKYEFESEESGDESEKGNKKVQFLKDKYKGEFTNMVCKNCVKALEECRCAEGVIPSWQQGCCKFCMRDEEHCICEEGFTALKDGDLKSPQKL